MFFFISQGGGGAFTTKKATWPNLFERGGAERGGEALIYRFLEKRKEKQKRIARLAWKNKGGVMRGRSTNSRGEEAWKRREKDIDYDSSFREKRSLNSRLLLIEGTLFYYGRER